MAKIPMRRRHFLVKKNFDETFTNVKMTEIIQAIENNLKNQEHKELIFDKKSNESYNTQPQTGQNAISDAEFLKKQ